MSKHSNLDRAYFSLIDSCSECVKMATMVACNSNYKETIQEATDQLIVDCCKEAMRLRQTLQEVIALQKAVYERSTPNGR